MRCESCWLRAGKETGAEPVVGRFGVEAGYEFSEQGGGEDGCGEEQRDQRHGFTDVEEEIEEGEDEEHVREVDLVAAAAQGEDGMQDARCW